MTSKTILQFVKDICAFSPRQFEGMFKTAEYIKNNLRESDVSFSVKKHTVEIPKILSVQCRADKRDIPCLATSLTGGKIKGVDALTSSLISSRHLINTPNINFNPRTAPGVISRSNFYFAPSIAIAHDSIPDLLQANKVEANVKIRRAKIEVETIYVGNIRNPARIIFAHYDSIGTGALDNASGVAVLLSVLTQPGNKKYREENLFVFDGNEELSYTNPTYWGEGFRVFEKKHKALLARAREIIVVDCVGNGKPEVSTDPKIINLAFPLKNIATYASKVKILGGDIEKLMPIYHTDEDTPDKLSSEHLEASLHYLIGMLKK